MLGKREVVWDRLGYRGGSLVKCTGLQELEIKLGGKQGEGRQRKSSKGLEGQLAVPGHLARTQGEQEKGRYSPEA